MKGGIRYRRQQLNQILNLSRVVDNSYDNNKNEQPSATESSNFIDSGGRRKKVKEFICRSHSELEKETIIKCRLTFITNSKGGNNNSNYCVMGK